MQSIYLFEERFGIFVDLSKFVYSGEVKFLECKVE